MGHYQEQQHRLQAGPGIFCPNSIDLVQDAFFSREILWMMLMGQVDLVMEGLKAKQAERCVFVCVCSRVHFAFASSLTVCSRVHFAFASSLTAIAWQERGYAAGYRLLNSILAALASNRLSHVFPPLLLDTLIRSRLGHLAKTFALSTSQHPCKAEAVTTSFPRSGTGVMS